MYKQAWWLARQDLKQSIFPFIITIIATIVFAGFASLILDQSIRYMFDSGDEYYSFFVMDFMFFILTPSLAAIFMSKPYLSFRTIKEDPFSKIMAFYRALPIPVKVISLSRTFIMLVTVFIMGTTYFCTIYVLLRGDIFQFVHKSEFIVLFLIWFGYSLAIGGVNTFIEYGTNGKMLHVLPYIFIGIFIVVAFIFHYFFQIGIVEWTLHLAMNIGWPIVILSFVIGVLGCYFWYKMLTARLLTRDYL